MKPHKSPRIKKNHFMTIRGLSGIGVLDASAYPGPDVEFDVGVSNPTLNAKQFPVQQDSVLGGSLL